MNEQDINARALYERVVQRQRRAAAPSWEDLGAGAQDHYRALSALVSEDTAYLRAEVARLTRLLGEKTDRYEALWSAALRACDDAGVTEHDDTLVEIDASVVDALRDEVEKR